ncbi:MAG: DNA-directed RNA polymerase subunit omega [Clostridia bacterium]|nr:DNA-directed RNA polymerase subunit omega [Clostridia bacterium]
MMLYPAIGDLEKVTHSRYALVTVTAKRARQLLEISENNKIPLTDKPVKLAINDIATGKVTCRAADDISEESEETTSDSDNTEE